MSVGTFPPALAHVACHGAVDVGNGPLQAAALQGRLDPTVAVAKNHRDRRRWNPIIVKECTLWLFNIAMV